jgi:multiple sugar transport system permease protein
MARQKIGNYLFLMPALIVIMGLILYPLAYNIQLSFTSMELGPDEPEFIGLGNYARAFSDSRFIASYGRTLYILAIAVSSSIVMGLGLALWINKVQYGRTVFRILLLLPILVSGLLVGITWKYMYEKTWGIINYFTGLIGVSPIGWVAEPEYALYAVIIVDIWQWTPYAFVVFSAGLDSLPIEPFEAARIDGASGWSMFAHLTLPLLTPLLIIVALFRSVWVLRIFDTVFALTEGGPMQLTETISIFVQKNMFLYGNFGYASALSVIMFGTSIVIAVVLARRLIKETTS